MAPAQTATPSAATFAAVPKPKTAGASVVTVKQQSYDSASNFCSGSNAGVIRWGAVKGVASYTVVFNDAAYGGAEQRVGVAEDFESGEFEGDTPPEGATNPELNAPARKHQLIWTGGSYFGPGPCQPDTTDYSTRLTNAHVEYFQDGEFVDGTVTGPCEDGDCPPAKGVKVTAKGDGGGSDTTDSGGQYSIKVKKGSYTVVPSKGASKFNPEQKKVHVAADSTATADFKIEAAPRIVGRVTLGCDVHACSNVVVPDAHVIAAPAGGGKAGSSSSISEVTDEDGRYTIDVPKSGVYEVRAEVKGMRVKPGSEIVDLSGDQSKGKADFHACGLTGGGSAAARAVANGTWETSPDETCASLFVFAWQPTSESLRVGWIGVPECSAGARFYAGKPKVLLRNQLFGADPRDRVTVTAKEVSFLAPLSGNPPAAYTISGKLTDSGGGNVTASYVEANCDYQASNVPLRRK